MTKQVEWRRRPWLFLVAAVLAAIALAGCLPPQPAPTAAPPTQAPAPDVKPVTTTTTRPPTLPLAPSGVSASPVLTQGKIEDFPDPFVLRVDDAARCGTDSAPCYYAYSTAAGFLGLTNVPVWRSTDLAPWTWVGDYATTDEAVADMEGRHTRFYLVLPIGEEPPRTRLKKHQMPQRKREAEA